MRWGHRINARATILLHSSHFAGNVARLGIARGTPSDPLLTVRDTFRMIEAPATSTPEEMIA
jgi:hypothetical protein